MLRYRQIVELKVRNATGADQADAIAELKRRDDLRFIAWTSLVTVLFALIVVFFTAWMLCSSDALHAFAHASVQNSTAQTQPATQPTHTQPATQEHVSFQNAPASQPATQPATHPASTENHSDTGQSLCPTTWAAAFVAVLWALAWFFSGMMGGFLFGIPKTQNEPDKTKPGYHQQPNTNLEQISDWLTKIIVGLGLVQLRNLPNYLWNVSNYMATCGITCKPFACAIVIAFSVLGLMVGYLLTRMFLASAFGRADIENNRAGASLSIGPAQSGAGNPKGPDIATVSSPSLMTAQSPAASSANTSAAAQSAASKSEAFLGKWSEAKGNVLEGRYDTAVAEYAELVRQAPTDIAIRLEYCWALYKLYNTWTKELQDNLDVAKSLPAATGSATRRELYESLCFYPLYRDKGYDEAIKFGEEYTADPRNQLSASIYADLACAYGQKIADPSTNKTEHDAIRKKALESVRAAVRLDAGMAKVLQLQMVGPNRDENDLASFQNDNEFRTALFLPTLRPSSDNIF